MNIVCLDMEGVLVPEIWIAFAEASGIPELRRTTRDEPDYDKLMRWRLSVLKEHGLGLKEIQDVIAKIDPMPGAKAFLDALRAATGASSSSRRAFRVSNRALCSAWVPWEKLNRATFIPAWIISRRTPSLSVDGPKVHTIFVFRIFNLSFDHPLSPKTGRFPPIMK